MEAWGFNLSGQLGNGTTTTSTTPVAVTSLAGSTSSVAAGGGDSFAIQNGGLLGWGNNAYGALGVGPTPTYSDVPIPVTNLSSGVTMVTAGSGYGLAMQNGAVLSWGLNNDGQLGNGTTTNSSTPVAVTGLSGGVTAVSAGAYQSVALVNGAVYDWGYNNEGQLGNGTRNNSNTPVAVTNLSGGVTSIAGGLQNTLAIKNGALFVWGYNVDGELGNGTTVQYSTFPVAVTNLSSGVTAIAGGGYHCLAVQDGEVYAWGSNVYGQLGNGTTISSSTPQQIDPGDLNNIVAVAAAAYSSYALSADGTLWVWGNNANGELGLGTSTADYLAPQHLLPPSGEVFTSIDANCTGDHAIATLAVVPLPEPAGMSLLAVGGFLVSRRRTHRHAKSSAK